MATETGHRDPALFWKYGIVIKRSHFEKSMLGNFFHDNETTVMTVVSRINFSLRGGGGIVLSIVMATQLQLWWVLLKVQRLCIINPLEPVQGSQVVQLDIISFPTQTVSAVHLLMVESCWFIRPKLCRVSQGTSSLTLFLPVVFCVYNTGFLLKSGFFCCHLFTVWGIWSGDINVYFVYLYKQSYGPFGVPDVEFWEHSSCVFWICFCWSVFVLTWFCFGWNGDALVVAWTCVTD